MRHYRVVLSMLSLSVALAACDDSSKTTDAVLAGRVFAVEQGKPISQARIVAPGGKEATTGADGSFEVRARTSDKAVVEVTSKDGAPVSKPAPKRGGYVELYVKRYDAQRDIDAKQGGAVVGKNGAGAKVGPDALRDEDGKAAARAHLGIAAPNPKQGTDVRSLPGNFGAKRGTKRGMLSPSSAVYVGARDGERELELTSGKGAEVAMPVHAQGSTEKAAGVALYRFDASEGVWVEQGSAHETRDENDQPVYRGQITSLGWWAVGDFYDRLTCIRGCVRDARRAKVASARVIVAGVDHVAELTTFAGDDGCFALDVRAGAEVRVAAQVEDGLSDAELVHTSAALHSADTDAAACQDVGTLTVHTVERHDCPLGFEECSNACVDTALDVAHCGGCDQRCDTSCLAGQCAGQDAGTPQADSSVPTSPDASEPGQRNLSLSFTGSGAGAVTSTPVGLDCSDSCAHAFVEGTTVTLQATADAASSSFAGWSGDCAGNDGPTCVLEMAADHSAGVAFALANRSLDVTIAAGTGMGSVVGQVGGAGPNVVDCGGAANDCAETVPHGTSITLTAVPAMYSTFTWGGACAGNKTASCTVLVGDATSVSVTFTRLQYTLSMRMQADASVPGAGTATSMPAGISCSNVGSNGVDVVCNAVFDAGTTVQLDVVPATMCNFVSWGGACASDPDTSCTIQITADTDVSALFVGVIG